MLELTVNGPWEYLVISDLALATVEWRSPREEGQELAAVAAGALGASLAGADAIGLGDTSGELATRSGEPESPAITRVR